MVLLKRIIVISMLALLLGMMVMNFSVTYAAGPGGWKGNINNGQKAISSTKSFLSNVLGVVRTVGMIIAVVILIVIACKYMLAAPSDRADLKKYMVIYVVGALILFGAAGLVSIVKTITDDALGGS